MECGDRRGANYGCHIAVRRTLLLEREKNKNLNSPAEKVVRKYVNTLTADDNNSNYSQQGADHRR